MLGEQMDSILFHDGIEEDMKGYMFATKVDYDGGTIDSIEAAQSAVSEYIPAGSGITSNWRKRKSISSGKRQATTMKRMVHSFFILSFPKATGLTRFSTA